MTRTQLMSSVARKTESSPVLQRKCACGGRPGPSGECEACRKKRLAVQRRASAGEEEAATNSPMFDEVLRSSGEPLENATRIYMEKRFGHDFSQVRIHTGLQATDSARSLNADAYTFGHNIVFNSGQYSPGSFQGRQLLAHELTHVVQQRAAADAPAITPRPIYGSPNSSAETEAENVGSRVAHGHQAMAHISVGPPTVQRQPQSPPAGDQKGAIDNATERILTRPEERKLSESSAGEIEIKAEPILISLYNFPIDKATLKPEHRAVLKSLALLLSGAKGANLELLLMGHTDSSGEPDVNNPISKRRAVAVRNALPRRGSISMQTFWFGEERPVVTNETVDGRSRNRRVDIYLVPREKVVPRKDVKPKSGELEIDIIIYLKTGRKVRKTETKKKKDEPEKKKPPQDEDDGGKDDKEHEHNGGGGGGGGGGDGWDPCDGLLLSALCAAGGAWGAKKILCAVEPELCALYEWLKDDDDDDDKKKPPEDKDEPEKEKKRKACPGPVELPTGVHRVPDPSSPSPLYIKWPFDMTLKFRQETPDHSPYCDCNCGEYRQEVRGWYEDNLGGGPVARKPHHLRHGIYMDPDVFLEDGIETDPTHGYGHRYLTFVARRLSKDDARPFLAQNQDNDRFVDDAGQDDREDGCTYKGHDAPGVAAFYHPNVEYHFHFWFRGGPVDGCNGDTEIGDWHEWEVIGDRVPPQPPPPTTKPGPSKTRTRSRPYNGPASGDQVAFVYAGGMEYAAIKEATGSIKIQFESQGEFHTTYIEIFITEVTDSTVLFETTNNSAINVAPEGHRPLVISPHTSGFIPKDKLRPPDP